MFESVSNTLTRSTRFLQPATLLQHEDLSRPPRRSGLCLCSLHMAGAVGWLDRPGRQVRPHCQGQQPH